MSRKIVFLDIDGTLVDYGTGMNTPLDSTKNALQKLKESGNYCVVCTARSKSFLPEEIVALEADGYILSNGNHIEINNKSIYDNHFSKEQLEELVKLFKEMKCEYFMQNQEYIYANDIDNPLSKEHISIFKMPEDILKKVEDIDGSNINQVCAVFKSEDSLFQCEKRLFEGIRADVYTDFNNRMDIVLEGSSKGHAVKVLCDHLKISFENTFAFGNDINDIEMFKAVKYGIAMENSEDRVKECAYYVTDDVHEDGIYNALKKFGCI